MANSAMTITESATTAGNSASLSKAGPALGPFAKNQPTISAGTASLTRMKSAMTGSL